jgi:DNA-binding CsgD family transcriptional regulator
MTSIRLSRADCDRFAHALSVLLSPLEHAQIDDWRVSVNRALKDLLGADMVTFQIPSLTPASMLSEEVDHQTLMDYPDYLTQWDRRFNILERMQQMGGWTRGSLWGDKIDLLYNSAYWHDLLVPARACQSAGITAGFVADAQPATVYFNRSTRGEASYGEREEQLLQLLQPAFQASLLARVRHDEAVARLGSLFDGLPNPLLLADVSGTPVHRNDALRELLNSDLERDSIADALHRMAADVAVLIRTSGRTLVDVARSKPLSRTLRVGTNLYRMWGSVTQDCLPGSAVLVWLQRIDNRPGRLPGVETLQERHRLTHREAEVALLLAERRTNAETATLLGISEHTARHHTERVLTKLGAHSRHNVRAILLQSAREA